MNRGLIFVQELKENGNENEKTGVSCVANLARLK
jgi:hypothetical protein